MAMEGEKGNYPWRGVGPLSPSPCKILMYLTPELGKAAGS